MISTIGINGILIATIISIIANKCTGQEVPNGCLLEPYISSFYRFEVIPANLTNNTAHIESRVNLRFTIDNTVGVSINNLHMQEYRGKTKLFAGQNTTTKITPRSQSDLIYSSSSLPNAYFNPPSPYYDDSVPYLESGKYLLYRAAEARLKDPARSNVPKIYASPCNGPNIADADLTLRNVGWNQHRYYSFRKSTVCSSLYVYNISTSLYYKGEEKRESCRLARYGLGATAAVNSPSNTHHLLALSGGQLILGGRDAIEPGDETKNYFGTPLLLTYRPSIGPLETQEPILNSSVCLKATKELLSESARPDGYVDYTIKRPIVTLTKSIDGSNDEFITAEGYEAELFSYNLTLASRNQFKGARTSWQKKGIFAENNLRYVIAMTIYNIYGMTRCHILSKPQIMESTVYYINSAIRDDYSIVDAGELIDDSPTPDDITYWSSCKKIVSFYGFEYIIHNYKDNIIEDAGNRNLLMDSIFDHPIEAVHAEGENFYFFLRATTLYHIVVKTSECDKLAISKSFLDHHQSQFFQFNQVAYRYSTRYFDGNNWVPNPNQELYPPLLRYPKFDTGGGSPTRFWVYLLIAFLCSILLLILVVVVLIRKFRPEASSSHCASSHDTHKSAGSYHSQALPPQMQQPHQQQYHHTKQHQDYPSVYPQIIQQARVHHQETASVMPLFADQPSEFDADKAAKKATTKKAKSSPAQAKTPRSPLSAKRSTSGQAKKQQHHSKKSTKNSSSNKQRRSKSK